MYKYTIASKSQIVASKDKQRKPRTYIQLDLVKDIEWNL